MKKIVEKNNRLFIEIDGKEIEPIAYVSYLPRYADYADFAKLGYNLFSVCSYMGDLPINLVSGIRPLEEGLWKARDVYDFSPLERTLKIALEGNENAYILLRMNVNVPHWWVQENPDESTLLEDGTILNQSVFSKKWFEDVGKFFVKLKEFLDGSKYKDNVIAIQVGAMNTEEWLAPSTGECDSDFSRCATLAFIDYCKNKYKSVSNLNRGWRVNYESFNEITVPSGAERKNRNKYPIINETKEKRVNDWHRCINEAYAFAIETLLKKLRALYGNEMLLGCF